MSGPVPVRFRIGQRDFGASAWLVTPFLPDEELAALGWKLAGPGRDAFGLTFEERDELGYLLDLYAKQRSPEETEREAELLSRCPFTTFVPPIDVDVNEKSPAFLKIGGPQEAYAATLRYAQALTATGQDVGLGIPRWHRTNARGGTHGDLRAPETISDPNLLLHVRSLVRKAARLAGVPLLSQQPHTKELRKHAVYVDDTLFARTTSMRGVQWRLVGACKPGREPKQPWCVFTDTPMSQPTPLMVIAPQALVAERDAELAAEEEEETKDPVRAVAAVERNRALYALTRAGLTADDMAWIESKPGIKAQYETPLAAIADRSNHLWHVLLAAKIAGADDSLLTRIGWGMPGSKAAEREDSFLLNQIAKLSHVRRQVRTNRIVVDRGEIEIIPELFDWCALYFQEAKDPAKLAEALFRVFSEGKAESDGWRFDHAVEAVWQAMGQTGTRGTWTRVDTFAAADEILRRTKDGEVKLRGWRWLTRGFGLAAAHGLVGALMPFGYGPRDRPRLYMRSIGSVRYDNSAWQREKLKAIYQKITPPMTSKRQVLDGDEESDGHGEAGLDEAGNPVKKRRKVRWEKVTRQDSAAESPFSRIRNTLRRPTGCMHFHDQVLDADDRHELGKRHVVCEQRATCPSCAVRSLASAFSMLCDQTSEWSWEKTAKAANWPVFNVCWTTAETVEQIREVRALVNASNAPFSKIVTSFVDLKTGRPGLMYVATDIVDVYVRGPSRYAAVKGHSLDTWRELDMKSTQDPLRVASWIMEAALSNVCWTEQLMREDRDNDLLDWVSFWKNKPLITSRNTLVKWPSRSAVRDDLVKPAESFEEYEGQKLVYALTHTQTNYVVDTSLIPHTIDQALEAAAHNTSFQQFHERFLVDLGVDSKPARRLETKPKIRPPRKQIAPPDWPAVIRVPVPVMPAELLHFTG